jgi:hypothetical protein
LQFDLGGVIEIGYKDEEKKVIKNIFFSCFLILFDRAAKFSASLNTCITIYISITYIYKKPVNDCNLQGYQF